MTSYFRWPGVQGLHGGQGEQGLGKALQEYGKAVYFVQLKMCKVMWTR